MLRVWVQGDLLEGQPGLARALENWRNDVITRVSDHRPQRIRIPMIFVTQLGLDDQRVLLTEGDAVVTVNGKKDEKGQYRTGRILIPRKG